MGAFEVRKAQSNTNDGFNETLKYYVMHQANFASVSAPAGGHNKYYCLELQKHPDGRYRIFTHYGRLGVTNIYEVREKVGSSFCMDQNLAEKEFESIHKKKLAGKSVVDPDTGEKIKEAYVDVDVVSPQVGSENIRGKAEVKKQVTVKSAIDVSSFDPEVAKLVDQLIEENVHNITTMTSIKYTANGFSTEVGAVTPSHVDKARKVLDDLNNRMDKKGQIDGDDKEVQRINALFFSLIPKPFSSRISLEDMILDAKKLQDEYDLLDQLATGVQMGSAMQQNTASRMNALGTDIEILKDKAERDRITKYIVESKASNHRGSDVWNFRVRQIYKIRIPDERSRYEPVAKKLGSIQEVFHGSANSNLLSILKSGLIIPKSNAPQVCGRNFGDGCYGAINSTKSLNYSVGYWGGKRSKYANNFLFLADFAMGKTQIVQSAVSGPSRGYDSVWAKKGVSLYNDELIVYTLPQVTLRYLVEMVK